MAADLTAQPVNPASASRPDPRKQVRLGDQLIADGLLRPEQLQKALEEQRRTGRKLGRVFVDNGWVTEEQISHVLARQMRLPYLDLARRPPPPELARLLPEIHARRLRALVVAESGAGLVVGMTDPTDINAFDEISRLLRRDVSLVVVSESQLLTAIDQSYQHTDVIAGLAGELTSEVKVNETRLAELMGVAEAGNDDAPVVKLLDSIFEEAMRVRASDIHIEPEERCLRIRFRIDGVLYVQAESDAKISATVALRLKLMAGLDIAERRLPQDGRFRVQLTGENVDVRISTLPTQFGESVVMRLLRQSAGLLDLRRLGLPPRMAETLMRIIERPTGMVLVTGPTGSGKTTTLYSVLNHLNSPGRKIVTVEDPVEYRLPGINQVQVQDKIDLSFERVLRSTLRQDPDVVLIGEMRDRQTAEIGIRAAMTGHLVLSTLHTNDAISTPMRLADMGVPRYMVALSLQLVIAQRLVRVLCQHCREPYLPSTAETSWLRQACPDDPDAAQATGLWHAGGCASCNRTGYSGRTGVYEMLEMTRELSDALNSDDGNRFSQAARRRMAGHTLRDDAVRLAREGRTSLQEAMRIGSQLED